ncbi:MAG: PDZ domain-containing protein [Actinomycetota bacterium]|nr:PDZ domain-containing protein [Actinomycetota bacterium]
MSPSDWNDDEQQQPAPLPAHERVWRHPSEIGEQVWRQTEPPLAIGRGLTAATGVVGSVLGVTLLWAMLSTEAGRGAVATARSTIVTLTEHDFGTGLTTGVTDTTASPSTTVRRTTPATSPPSTSATGPVDHLVGAPLPTWQVHSPARSNIESTQGSLVPPTPTVLAVPVNGGTLAITTSAAVADAVQVQLELPDGSETAARVLFVDERTGLAVLAPNTLQSSASFTVAADIQPGDELTFLGGEPVTITVAADGSMTGQWADDESMPEGAPVVNQRGELVALCSHQTEQAAGEGDAHLVTLETLDDIQQAMAAFQGVAPVWLGVVINDDPSGDLSVGAVDPAGPAALAGLTAGDVIVALDDNPIADCRELIAQLGMHRAGDVVRFSVLRANGTKQIVTVTLAGAKTTL